MHVYKASEWQTASGRWHVADTQDLAHNSAVWWIPPQIFGLTYEDYIQMLVQKYHAAHFSYNNNVLLFAWDSYKDAHQYLLDINRIARQKNFKIC